MEGSHINTKLSDLHHWLRYPRLARFGTTRHLSLTYTLCMSGTRSRRTRLTWPWSVYRPGKRSQWLCAKCECRDQDGGTSPVERKPRAKRTLRHTTRLAPLPSTSKVRENQTPVADVHQTHSVQRSGRWDQPRRAQAPCGMTSNQSHYRSFAYLAGKLWNSYPNLSTCHSN